MVIGMIVLVVWSLLLKAPIEEPANPARTPNPSKAPWYFLGLQEMLVYFDPWMAGVVFPSLIIVGLMAIPYIDTNPKGNGYYTFKERKVEITLFLFGFLILWVLLVILGTFLRGPNWNFFGPYEYWDLHKLEALNNVNLSEYVWVKMLHTKLPRGRWACWCASCPASCSSLFYIGVLPGILAMTRKTWSVKLGSRACTMTFGLRKYFEKLGPWRYSDLRDAAAVHDRAAHQDGAALDAQPEVHRRHAGDLLQHLSDPWHLPQARTRPRPRDGRPRAQAQRGLRAHVHRHARGLHGHDLGGLRPRVEEVPEGLRRASRSTSPQKQAKQAKDKVPAAQQQALQAELDRAKQEEAQRRDQIKKAQGERDKLEGEWYAVDQNFRFTKAEIDVKRYDYEEAAHKNKGNKDKKLADLKDYEERWEKLRVQLEDVNARKDAKDKEIAQLESTRLDAEKTEQGALRGLQPPTKTASRRSSPAS